MRGREIGADMAFEATHGGGTGDTGTGLEVHRHLRPTVCGPRLLWLHHRNVRRKLFPGSHKRS